jgi:hypothetical protein
LVPIATLSAPIFAAIGIVSGFYALKQEVHPGDPARAARVGIVIVLGVVLVGFRTLAVQIPLTDNISGAVWGTSALMQIALLLTRIVRPSTRYVAAASVVVSILATAIIGVRLVNDARDVGLTTDVIEMHDSALEVILKSQNPYEFATADNSDSLAPPGDRIVGYVYPPMAMAPIVASGWIFGDPRWVLLGSWLGFLGMTGWRVAKDHPNLLPIVPILSLFLPLRFTLFAGWTEPITLVLASVVLTKNIDGSPWLRILGLSAAGASKQHFALAAPLLVYARFTHRTRLIASTLLLGLLTLLPYLDVGARQLWQALVGNLPPNRIRGDSYSFPTALTDLGFDVALLPRPVWLAFVIASGILAGRMVRSIGRLLIGTGLVLAIAYLLGLGFINYWLLVASLCALGAVVVEDETRTQHEAVQR